MAEIAAHILIVEDKESLRTMLRHALEREGHGVLEASDEPEAVHGDARRVHPGGRGVLLVQQRLE